MKANPIGTVFVGWTSGRNPWIFEDAYPTWPSFSTIKTSLYIYTHFATSWTILTKWWLHFPNTNSLPLTKWCLAWGPRSTMLGCCVWRHIFNRCNRRSTASCGFELKVWKGWGVRLQGGRISFQWTYKTKTWSYLNILGELLGNFVFWGGAGDDPTKLHFLFRWGSWLYDIGRMIPRAHGKDSGQSILQKPNRYSSCNLPSLKLT